MRKLHDPEEICPPSAFAAAGRPAGGRTDSEPGVGKLPGTPGPALRFDWADWLPYLEDQDVPEEQKRALIENLWAIVVAFVDLGWRIDPKPETGAALDLRAILTDTDTKKEDE